MLQQEFQERVNFTVTEDCYHRFIEPEYNASKLDKDEWCKQWKKDHGIQRAYSWMAKQVEEMRRQNEELARFKELYDEQHKITIGFKRDNEDLSETLSKIYDKNIELAIFLAEITEKYSSPELREKVIEMMGEAGYITYKLQNNKSLWDIDKKLIIDVFNNNIK